MEDMNVRVTAIVPPVEPDTQSQLIIESVEVDAFGPARVMVQIGDSTTVVHAHHLITAVKAARLGGARY